jgi:hypothetical protein
MIEMNLVTGDPSTGDAIGYLNPERVQRQIDQLLDLGILAAPQAAEDLILTSTPP